jgi:hypothetical protein
VPLERGARAVLLADDGGDHAAAAHGVAGAAGARAAPTEAPCGLALLDLRTGAVAAACPLSAPPEPPTGLALQPTAAGPVATVPPVRRGGAAGADPARPPADTSRWASMGCT